MAAKLTELAQQYINEATRNPRQSSQILRHAAAHFASLAEDPANRRARENLTSIGLDFAGAAMQQQETQEAEPTTNDFTQLLRDTHQAMVELGPDAMTTSHAAMDTLAQRRANDTEDANHMSVQPRTFLNRDTTLGRSAKIKFNPTDEEKLQGIRQSETVAFWQGRKQESQAMSIDFGLVIPPTPFPDINVVGVQGPIIDARISAELQYGADGNTQNIVDIDVALGRRVTVVGNYISVLVKMDPPRNYTTPMEPQVTISSPTLVVGASIGTFSAISVAPVTRTIYIDELPALTISPFFAIPQRASLLLPPLAASSTDTLTIGFFSFNFLRIGTWTATYSPALPSWAPYPVPADAYYFTVTSAQGVPSVPPLLGARNGLRIPFELNL